MKVKQAIYFTNYSELPKVDKDNGRQRTSIFDPQSHQMPSQLTTTTKTYLTRSGWQHESNDPPKGKNISKLQSHILIFPGHKSTHELTAYPIAPTEFPLSVLILIIHSY